MPLNEWLKIVIEHIDVHYHIHNDSLKLKVDLIMATLQEFIDQQTTFNASLDASVVGITADIDSLNAKIAALIAAGGAITPAQQVAIDALVAHGALLAAKVAALDALTPPVVPTA